MKPIQAVIFFVLVIFGFLAYVVVNESLKTNTPKENEPTDNIWSKSPLSKLEDYVDSLKQKQEKVLLDTFITHFGHRPGYLEYDTTYIVSYETKYINKANKVYQAAKKVLGKN